MNNASIFSAARGPIMLITVGSLLAMDNMLDVSFSRTWPVLIIVFGVMKLMERMAARPAEAVYEDGYQTPRPPQPYSYQPPPPPAPEPPQERPQ